jgi:CrcB protein
MSAPSRTLHHELADLALVAAGAIPGALLRWRLENDFIANMLGCLVLGLVLAQSERRKRLVLGAGIGFCGSLTTFSSWMLELARNLLAGNPWDSLVTLVATLFGGLVLVALGHTLAKR